MRIDPVILEMAKLYNKFTVETPDGVRIELSQRIPLPHTEPPRQEAPVETGQPVEEEDIDEVDDEEERSESKFFPGMVFLNFSNCVEYKGISVQLMPLQFKILKLVDKNQKEGGVNTCDLITSCWRGKETPKDSTVRSAVSRLDTELATLKLGKNLRTVDYKVFFE